MSPEQFAICFKSLTGHAPFPWQAELYRRFTAAEETIPPHCDIPTGLGKTSVIAVWLIALVTHSARVPRRLAYVVNRRTVVDQTTAEVEKLRDNLGASGLEAALQKLCALPADCPLAVSTLRGAYADNREWSADPCRPAVIVGTVDLIGSRLLFSGYRAGFKTRPLFAGFLGQDTLIVHDEAHLEPAFQDLLTAIATRQKTDGDARPVTVMQLSATTRGGETGFGLTDADMANSEVATRLNARKRLVLHPLDDPKRLPDTLAELALRHKDSGAAVLVFAHSVETVEKVTGLLRKQTSDKQVRTLTGTMRGKERDDLVGDDVFRRFLPRDESPRFTAPTVYLICTSAGEVGVNLSADHLVCDLTTFESMAQRLGRVNRFGQCDDTQVDVVCVIDPKDADYAARLEKTRELLERLHGDASPAALRGLGLTKDEREAAFSKEPEILKTSGILFDAWTLTTVREALPGRPPVKPYLHGVAESEPPVTEVAWREEVGVIVGELLDQHPPVELLDVYPLKPREILRDRSDRVWKHLEKIAQRRPGSPVWIVDEDSDHVDTRFTLSELLAHKERNKDCIDGRTLLLPPDVGRLENGMLAGGSSDEVRDVADFHDADEPQTRLRLWDVPAGEDARTDKMQLVREIRVRDDIDAESGGDGAEDDGGEPASLPSRQVWRWYGLPSRADAENSRYARRDVLLKDHNAQVERYARTFAEKLGLPPGLKEAVRLAGQFHDAGKARSVWQKSIGNHDPDKILAKSNGRAAARAVPTGYRHEWGSLLDLLDTVELKNLSEEMQDVTLHLIAAHHGRARPHFSSEELQDWRHTKAQFDALAVETPRRFARLQRRYGRWGLAFLESLLRAADYAASANPDEAEKKS